MIKIYINISKVYVLFLSFFKQKVTMISLHESGSVDEIIIIMWLTVQKYINIMINEIIPH